MKDKKSFIEKISSGKGFYFTAGFSVVIVLVAIFVVYSTTANISKQYLNFTTVPTTGDTTTQITQHAEQNITDECDPRLESELATSEETTTTQSATQSTTVPSTEAEVVVPLNTSYSLPTQGKIIKGFSNPQMLYSETMGDWRVHNGVDFEVKEGEKVLSIGNGTVKKVSSDTVWGYIIEVDYGDFITRYCSIKQDGAVSIGDEVKMGDVIGEIAEIPCEAADGLHLHFEVIKDGVLVNPIEALGV